MRSLQMHAPAAPEPPRTKRIERSTDLAYQRLKQRILDNEYAPGTQVLEQELASDLGLSRTPVREALIRLQQEGLVEVVPRHGMRVLPLSPCDMREIYTVLTSLEPTAAELLAARRPSAEEISPLLDACTAMEAALIAKDRLAWAKADESFHRMLVELCGNRRLASMVMIVWEQSHRARMFTLKLRPLPVDSTREHRAALEAILAGDAVRARDIYRAHRERARDSLMAIIEQYGLSQL